MPLDPGEPRQGVGGSHATRTGQVPYAILDAMAMAVIQDRWVVRLREQTGGSSTARVVQVAGHRKGLTSDPARAVSKQVHRFYIT